MVEVERWSEPLVSALVLCSSLIAQIFVDRNAVLLKLFLLSVCGRNRRTFSKELDVRVLQWRCRDGQAWTRDLGFDGRRRCSGTRCASTSRRPDSGKTADGQPISARQAFLNHMKVLFLLLRQKAGIKLDIGLNFSNKSQILNQGLKP